jgi:hypothetical protein
MKAILSAKIPDPDDLSGSELVPSPTTVSDTPAFRTAKNFGHHSKLYTLENAFLAQI